MSSTKIRCGTQCLFCDYPIHFDTYYGCSHNCRYCFANNKKQLSNIRPQNQYNNVKRFIEGKRTVETNFCDWNIPLHWGANSDPFQKCEYEYKKSLEILELLVETKYPVIISTKNPVILTESPYFDLIQKCNCVLQISMVCSRYDKIEKGAPKYSDRLKAMSILADKVQRIIIRVQPYFAECFVDVINEIPKYKINGAYGVIVEGYYSFSKKFKSKFIKKVNKKFSYPYEILAPQFEYIKYICHENNLKFYCAENRLRKMGDNLTCCGIDGLEDFGFVPNTFNGCHIINNDKNIKVTESMKTNGTARVYHSLFQTGKMYRLIKEKSYFDMTKWILENKKEYINSVLKD